MRCISMGAYSFLIVNSLPSYIFYFSMSHDEKCEKKIIEIFFSRLILLFLISPLLCRLRSVVAVSIAFSVRLTIDCWSSQDGIKVTSMQFSRMERTHLVCYRFMINESELCKEFKTRIVGPVGLLIHVCSWWHRRPRWCGLLLFYRYFQTKSNSGAIMTFTRSHSLFGWLAFGRSKISLEWILFIRLAFRKTLRGTSNSEVL